MVEEKLAAEAAPTKSFCDNGSRLLHPRHRDIPV